MMMMMSVMVMVMRMMKLMKLMMGWWKRHLAAAFPEATQSKNDGSFIFLNNLKI